MKVVEAIFRLQRLLFKSILLYFSDLYDNINIHLCADMNE